MNLRAALFRALSDLKKNGFLGREAVLRKTMLDDCKGEKFEEAIAAFSTAVLRQCFTSQEHVSYDPAMRIATSSRLTNTEQDALLPLALAHRASLIRLLEERKRINNSNDANDSLIRSTLGELSQRSKDVHATSERDADKLTQARRDLNGAWAGSGSWADTILEGGRRPTTDLLLEMEFHHAWSVIREGGALADLPLSGSTDILANLDNRLEEQQARLQKWKEFRKSLAAERRGSTTETRPKTITPLVFHEHKELSVTTNELSKHGLDEMSQKEEYRTLLSDMKNAMDNLQCSSMPRREQQYPVASWTQMDVGADPQSNAQKDEGDRGKDAASKTPSDSHPSNTIEQTTPRMKDDLNISASSTGPLEVPTPRPTSDRSNTPSILVDADATPDPQGPNENATPDPEPQHQTPEPLRVATSLTERTRESMSLRPGSNTSRSGHVSVERSRQSFPVNRLESPHSPDHGQRRGARTPQEELFNQDADYASVFKSRPKVAMSPVNSPTASMPPFADEGGTYEEGSGQDGLTLESSPLARKQNRRL